MLAYDLDFGDILYLSAKVSGEKDDRGRDTMKRPIADSEPRETIAFLEGPDFRRGNEDDIRLHAVALAWLTSAVEELATPSEFQQALALFRRLLDAARATCGINGTITSLRSVRSCYWNDQGEACLSYMLKSPLGLTHYFLLPASFWWSGCAHRCLDRLAALLL